MLVFNTVDKGTYFRAFEFARQFARMGHEVTLMATSANRHFTHKISYGQGIKLIETPDLLFGALRSGWDLFNSFYRLFLINPMSFDIVHGFENRPVVLLPALKMKTKGVPIIWDWADWFGRGGSVEERPSKALRSFLRPIETLFEEKFRRLAKAQTTICSVLFQKALKFAVDPQSVYLVPNGLDHPSRLLYDKKDARKMLTLKKDDLVIGYVGSLFLKDALLMGEALNLVHKQNPNVKLIHIGQSKFNLKEIVGRGDNIILTGKVDQNEMSCYLAACDLCWLPFCDTGANRGRFPMKVSNYLAAGKPIISTNVGDVADLLMKYNAGIIIPPSASQLAQMTIELFENQYLQDELINSANNLSSNSQYSWETEARKVEKIYYAVLNKQK